MRHTTHLASIVRAMSRDAIAGQSEPAVEAERGRDALVRAIGRQPLQTESPLAAEPLPSVAPIVAASPRSSEPVSETLPIVEAPIVEAAPVEETGSALRATSIGLATCNTAPRAGTRERRLRSRRRARERTALLPPGRARGRCLKRIYLNPSSDRRAPSTYRRWICC